MPVGLVMSFCLIHASMKTVLWILFYRISPFDVIRIWGNPSEVTTCYLGNRGPYMEFLLSLIKELKNGLKIKENLIAIKKKTRAASFQSLQLQGRGIYRKETEKNMAFELVQHGCHLHGR